MSVIRRNLWIMSMLAMLMLAGGVAKSVSAAPAMSTKDVVLAWIDALNAHDATRLKALSNPNMLLESSEDGTKVTYDEFFATLHEDVENELHWEVVNIVETSADNAVVDAALTAHDIPVLPHGFVVNFTFTVADGRVTHAVDKLPDQTKAELAALDAGVGMPTTGSNDSGLLLGLLAAGLFAPGGRRGVEGEVVELKKSSCIAGRDGLSSVPACYAATVATLPKTASPHAGTTLHTEPQTARRSGRRAASCGRLALLLRLPGFCGS